MKEYILAGFEDELEKLASTAYLKSIGALGGGVKPVAKTVKRIVRKPPKISEHALRTAREAMDRNPLRK